MTAIIVVSPAKGTILNNQIKFYPKNFFFNASLRTFQPTRYTIKYYIIKNGKFILNWKNKPSGIYNAKYVRFALIN